MATVDPATETTEMMVAGLKEHIMGAGEEGIIARLKEGAQDLPRTVGTLTLAMVQEAARQAEEAQREFDLEMLLEVSADIIDSLLQLSEAIGLIDDPEDKALREDSLMSAVEAYMMSSETTPEEQEAAQQMLQQMASGGQLDEASQVISEIGRRQGVDPFAEEGAAPVDAAQGAGQPAPQPGQRPPLIGG